MFRSSVWMFATAVWLASAPLAAHHSAAAQYEVTKTISLKGVVREFRFVNPHSVVRLAVTDDKGGAMKDDKGKEVVWSAEWVPTSILRRFGMKPDALRPGDRVTIMGSPARDGSYDLLVNSITFEDGRRLGFSAPPSPPPNNNVR